MGNRIDIYGIDKKIDYYKKRIREDARITPANKQSLFDFFNYGYSMGLSNVRISIYATKLYYLSTFLDKDFKEVTKEDLVNLMAQLEQNSKLKPWTKHFYKVILKKFYKWLEGNDEVYPDKVKWIKVANKNLSNKLPEELLTQDEIRRLIDAALNPRDKAFCAVLFESGCRIGELAGLQIKHVTFNQHGAQIIVDGKTGMRRVLLIFSYQFLVSWLENHPFKDNPEAALWCSLTRSTRGDPVNYDQIRLQLQKIAKRAKITKKVNPHSFRHARATQLARLGLNESQMSAYLGWVPNTDMAGTYIHLAGKDVDDAILKAYGIKTEEVNENKLACMRCKTLNSISGRFCQDCGMPLTTNAAVELEEKQAELVKKLAPIMELLEDDKVKEFLANRLLRKE